MSKVVYFGGFDFKASLTEFERAMWCPEVERERQELHRKSGSLESELHHLRKFCWLERDHQAQRLGLRIDLDTTMLGMMAGKMDEVAGYVARQVVREIGNLYRY